VDNGAAVFADVTMFLAAPAAAAMVLLLPAKCSIVNFNIYVENLNIMEVLKNSININYKSD